MTDTYTSYKILFLKGVGKQKFIFGKPRERTLCQGAVGANSIVNNFLEWLRGSGYSSLITFMFFICLFSLCFMASFFSFLRFQVRSFSQEGFPWSFCIKKHLPLSLSATSTCSFSHFIYNFLPLYSSLYILYLLIYYSSLIILLRYTVHENRVLSYVCIHH